MSHYAVVFAMEVGTRLNLQSPTVLRLAHIIGDIAEVLRKNYESDYKSFYPVVFVEHAAQVILNVPDDKVDAWEFYIPNMIRAGMTASEAIDPKR